MGAGSVSRAKEELARKQSLLGIALISVAEEVNPKGGKPKHCITLANIWPQNMNFWEPSSTGEIGNFRVPEGNVQVPQGNFTSSTGEIKKEPYEEVTNEERKQQRGTRLPDDFCLNSSMREWAALNASHVDLDTALAEFRDYWISVPGARGRKLDWAATFRNRLRDLEARARRNGNGTNNEFRRPTAGERNASQLARNLAVVEELRRQSG